jgi:hypothetical protein
MTSAQEWHEAARHLVRDHGADPGELTRYAPSLDELAAEHEGVHRYAAAFPPVTHQHSGYPAASDPDYAPFAPALGGPRGDFAAFPNPAVPCVSARRPPGQGSGARGAAWPVLPEDSRP